MADIDLFTFSNDAWRAYQESAAGLGNANAILADVEKQLLGNDTRIILKVSSTAASALQTALLPDISTPDMPIDHFVF